MLSTDFAKHTYWGLVGTVMMADENSVQLYPNPVTDMLQVKTTATNPGSIEFLNVTGQKVHHYPLMAAHSEVKTSDLAAGIYLYRVLDGEGNLLDTGKLVKQ